MRLSVNGKNWMKRGRDRDSMFGMEVRDSRIKERSLKDADKFEIF